MHLSTDLEALRALSTPTVSNAIERFNIRPRNQGYMSSAIRCLFPDLGVMLGYAATGRFAARNAPPHSASRYESWKHLLQQPSPRVLVLQDMDQPPGVGTFVGEVMGSLFHRLGCVGVVTNGVVRDLDEAHALGFHYFASGVGVSHAYVHLIDFGAPVEIGGITVCPGELLHADKHGVLVVPGGIAADVPQAAEQVIERERRLIEHTRSDEFSLEEMKRLYES